MVIIFPICICYMRALISLNSGNGIDVQKIYKTFIRFIQCYIDVNILSMV